jgi:hypothetical protein
VVSDRSSEFEYFGEAARYCNPADPASIRAAAEDAVGAREREADTIAALQARMTRLTWDQTATATLGAYERALAARPAPRVEGARGFATLAYADELVADPGLLRAYGGEFGAADDATLVIYAGAGDPAAVEEGLVALVSEVGMGGDQAADMLALAQSHDENALAAGVDAVLSDRPPRPPFELLPHFAAADVSALRAAVER